MSTVRLAQRTVLALCLSIWTISLPVLTASESCMLCSVAHENQCNCSLLKNDCPSSSPQPCNKCVSGTPKNELPTRGPCSCPCCQYLSEIVSAIQAPKQRTQKEGGRIFFGLQVQPVKLHPVLNIHQAAPITHTAEQSVDRCICLCRLTI